MALWASVTVVAGLRYADGKAVNGPMAMLGKVFDKMFGLDTCRKIPPRNQNLNDLKDPCYFCPQGATYPHADQPDFQIANNESTNVLDCTGVSGVGGVNQHFLTSSAKTVDPVSYITRFFTGSPTGSIAQGQYDKKRFKHGTPYTYKQTGSTIGYYYSTDASGREIPLIPPAVGQTTIPSALATNPTAYGGSAATGYMPDGWNAWVRYPNGKTGTAITPYISGQQYTNPVPSTTFDPLVGFVVTGSGTPVQSASSNTNYVATALSYAMNKPLKYKSFSPSTAAGTVHPTDWATR